MTTPQTKNVLVMEFKDVGGQTRSIRISDPKPELTAETVYAAMEVINDLNAFVVISGSGPASIKGAKTIQTVTSNFDIVVS